MGLLPVLSRVECLLLAHTFFEGQIPHSKYSYPSIVCLSFIGFQCSWLALYILRIDIDAKYVTFIFENKLIMHLEIVVSSFFSLPINVLVWKFQFDVYLQLIDISNMLSKYKR